MFVTLALAQIAVSTLAAAVANAAVDPDIAARFARLDRDGDGAIAANEAPRVSTARTTVLPPPGQAAGAAAWIAMYDRDGDGRVSLAEFAGQPSPPALVLRASMDTGRHPD